MNIHHLEQLLVTQNPHWLTPPSSIPGHTRDLFTKLSPALSQPKLILTLSGSRRHGKTYLLKQSIAHLILHHSIPTQNILYFQFSAEHNEKDFIHQLLNLYLQKYAQVGKRYLFLDEVQYIDYWQDQVKHFYDNFGDLKIIVSGSTSLFYHQKSRESLAGRIFKFSLGALSFGEYLRFQNLQGPSKDRAEFISHLSLYQSHFPRYLTLGQYPELLTHPELSPSQYISDLASQIINFDIPYFLTRIDRPLFYQLIQILAHDLSEEYSAHNLAKSLDCDRRTISNYVHILEELGLFKICYNAAFKSMRKKLASSKKIYCLNSNLAMQLNHFDQSYLGDTRVFGRYFENYIFTRLLSKYESLEYYRLKDKELDFVTETDAYEVKSTGDLDLTKYQSLSTKLHKTFHLITPEDGYLL